MTDAKRVIIVGCGGIGSWLAPAIGRTLEFQAPGSMMILVDGDNYEEKNVERQNFDRIGNKAHVLRHTIQEALPNTFVIARPAWVVSEGDIEPNEDDEEEGVGKITAKDLLNEGDYVFAVVDNFAARKLILDAAATFDDIDIFLGGNDEFLYATTSHYRRREGKDITCHPGIFHDEYVNPPDKNPGELNCAERAKLEGGTQLLAANLSVVTMLMGRVAQVMFGTTEQLASAIANAEVCMDLGDFALAGHDRRTEHGHALEKAESKQYATA